MLTVESCKYHVFPDLCGNPRFRGKIYCGVWSPEECEFYESKEEKDQ